MKLSDKLELIKGHPSRNRIVMPPMDTLMANKGLANDFHIQHYGSRAFGGVGTIIVESIAVTNEGRIREADLGLWSDEHTEPLAKVVAQAHLAGAVIGAQLNHAGAKAEIAGFQTFGTTHYFDEYLDKPDFRLMTESDLTIVEQAFVDAAKRAKKAKFDFVEIHAAHGYLLNQLMHPVLNEVFEGNDVISRGQLLINIVKRIKEEVGIEIGVRFSFEDHDQRGVHPEYYKDMVELLSPMVSYFHASSGETISKARTDEIIKKAGTKLFRIAIAKQIKTYTDKPVITVGNFSTKEDVDEALAEGIDAVAIGRELIFNPNLLINTLLDVEEISEEDYHWNNNLWYSPKKYLGLMKMLKLK